MVYNLASLLEDSAHRVPERDAIILGEMSLSYARLDGAANQVANLLVSRGVAPGDKVALSCPNIPSFTIVYFGILKAGATVVPLNVLLKGREVAYHLRDSEAKAYLCFQGTPELPIGAEGRELLQRVVQAVLATGAVVLGGDAGRTGRGGVEQSKYVDALALGPELLGHLQSHETAYGPTAERVRPARLNGSDGVQVVRGHRLHVVRQRF